VSVIVPAWVKERTEKGVLAILGSEPPADAVPTFVPSESIESIVESEHEVNGLRFAVIVLRDKPQETRS
jgi:hypothetical protein